MSTEATGATPNDAPVYETPVKGVRVKSRQRTRRMLFWLWLTQAATSIIIPSVVAALGFRDWSEVPSLILMLVGAGAIAILPYWFMAGRVLLDKNEGWEVPGASSNAAASDGGSSAAASSAAPDTNPL
ncbi:hypothetical protein ACI1US_01568 [Leucobacter sp. BZR 635]